MHGGGGGRRQIDKRDSCTIWQAVPGSRRLKMVDRGDRWRKIVPKMWVEWVSKSPSRHLDHPHESHDYPTYLRRVKAKVMISSQTLQ